MTFFAVVLGLLFPCSQERTAYRLTPTRSANCDWVIPKLCLICFISFLVIIR